MVANIKYSIMTAKEVCDLISSVGFPIVMCGALIYYIINVNKKNDDTIKGLSDTINQNSKVLTELTTLIKTLVK